jgi:hypothetical protein
MLIIELLLIMLTKLVIGRLHQIPPFNLIDFNRCLVENADIPWNNAQMKFYNNSATQATAMTSPISIIAETMPITPGFKKVSLELNGIAAGNQGIEQLILYKQITKTI